MIRRGQSLQFELVQCINITCIQIPSCPMTRAFSGLMQVIRSVWDVYWISAFPVTRTDLSSINRFHHESTNPYLGQQCTDQTPPVNESTKLDTLTRHLMEW